MAKKARTAQANINRVISDKKETKMKKTVKTRSAKHPRVKRIPTPPEKLLHLHETRKGTKRRAIRRQAAGECPDVIGAVDTLDRTRHKLGCFAALFGGKKDIIDLVDHAGAWIILTEILDEIEEAENLLTGC